MSPGTRHLWCHVRRGRRVFRPVYEECGKLHDPECWIGSQVDHCYPPSLSTSFRLAPVLTISDEDVKVSRTNQRLPILTHQRLPNDSPTPPGYHSPSLPKISYFWPQSRKSFTFSINFKFIYAASTPILKHRIVMRTKPWTASSLNVDNVWTGTSEQKSTKEAVWSQGQKRDNISEKSIWNQQLENRPISVIWETNSTA